MHDVVGNFRSAILAVLGHAPEAIEPGRFHRFATSDRRGDSAGWCKLFDDMRGGVFGDYRQGISETWAAADPREMTREQQTELARQIAAATIEREAEQRRAWAEQRKAQREAIGRAGAAEAWRSGVRCTCGGAWATCARCPTC